MFLLQYGFKSDHIMEYMFRMDGDRSTSTFFDVKDDDAALAHAQKMQKIYRMKWDTLFRLNENPDYADDFVPIIKPISRDNRIMEEVIENLKNQAHNGYSPNEDLIIEAASMVDRTSIDATIFEVHMCLKSIFNKDNSNG